MNLLIVSYHEDPHASIVAAALHALGHTVTLWDAPVTSAAILASVCLDDKSLRWEIAGRTYAYDHFNTIWLRRRRGVSLPESIHDDDAKFARGEINAYFDNLWSIASPATKWIHSAQIATDGENKLKQLAIAQRIGFKLPHSLISNDRSAILEFIGDAEQKGEEIIYKTFRPAGWSEGDKVRLKHTTVVSKSNILSNGLVEAVPGIYQRRIAKSHEVRATFFGNRDVSVLIDSQNHPQGREDWRGAINLQGYLSPILLPTDIHEKCCALMAQMSLSMACFDFIVDEYGEYYFLEINQQGQFLWVEEQCPEAPMLDAFLAFILGEKPSSGRPRIALSEVMAGQSYQEIFETFGRDRYHEV